MPLRGQGPALALAVRASTSPLLPGAAVVAAGRPASMKNGAARGQAQRGADGRHVAREPALLPAASLVRRNPPPGSGHAQQAGDLHGFCRTGKVVAGEFVVAGASGSHCGCAGLAVQSRGSPAPAVPSGCCSAEITQKPAPSSVTAVRQHCLARQPAALQGDGQVFKMLCRADGCQTRWLQKERGRAAACGAHPLVYAFDERPASMRGALPARCPGPQSPETAPHPPAKARPCAAQRLGADAVRMMAGVAVGGQGVECPGASCVRGHLWRGVVRHHVGVHVVHHPQACPLMVMATNTTVKMVDSKRPTALYLAVHVQEVEHVHQNLNHRKATQHHDGRGAVRDDLGHDQPERDSRQDDGQQETPSCSPKRCCEVHHRGIVAAVCVVMRARATHVELLCAHLQHSHQINER